MNPTLKRVWKLEIVSTLRCLSWCVVGIIICAIVTPLVLYVSDWFGMCWVFTWVCIFMAIRESQRKIIEYGDGCVYLIHKDGTKEKLEFKEESSSV